MPRGPRSLSPEGALRQGGLSHVRPQSAKQANGQSTVRLEVIDSRSEWSTFVGGGARAF